MPSPTGQYIAIPLRLAVPFITNLCEAAIVVTLAGYSGLPQTGVGGPPSRIATCVFVMAGPLVMGRCNSLAWGVSQVAGEANNASTESHPA